MNSLSSLDGKKAKRFRYWIFTWNNPPNPWQSCLDSFQGLAYSQAQLEKGENGTSHVQGLLYFKTEVSSSHFKGLPCWTSGFPAKDFPTVSKYVTKVATRVEGPIELGLPPEIIRASNSYDATLHYAKKGEWGSIQADHYVKHFVNLKKIHIEEAIAYECSAPRGTWIVGLPGVGKSFYARTLHKRVFSKDPRSIWWDGYANEEAVIVDDLGLSHRGIGDELKRWMDQYAVKGEVKHGSVNLNYRELIVTSNYTPREIWAPDDLLVAAICRRCKFIRFQKNSRLLPICLVYIANYFDTDYVYNC